MISFITWKFSLMGYVLIIVVLLAVVFFVFFLSKKSQEGSQQLLPYFKISTLLSPAELSFYHVLKIAVSEKYDVSAKVRLADVISVQKGMPKTEWSRAFNKIKSKHLDFVLTDKDTSEIKCAIELDDASHSQSSRKHRDNFLEEALRISSLPLLRLPVGQAYSSHDIAQKLSSLINLEVEIETGEILDSEAINILIEPKTNEAEEAPDNVMLCPRCGSQLVERKSTKGKYAGGMFWGCSNFPKCRYTSVIGDSA